MISVRTHSTVHCQKHIFSLIEVISDNGDFYYVSEPKTRRIQLLFS